MFFKIVIVEWIECLNFADDESADDFFKLRLWKHTKIVIAYNIYVRHLLQVSVRKSETKWVMKNYDKQYSNWDQILFSVSNCEIRTSKTSGNYDVLQTSKPIRQYNKAILKISYNYL